VKNGENERSELGHLKNSGEGREDEKMGKRGGKDWIYFKK